MSKSGEDGKNATVVSESGGGTFDILAISAMLGRLKHLKRTGWVHHQVDSPETVACHMYRMSMLAQLLEGPLDRDRCVRMALVHDLGEAIVGDITPQCGVDERDKYEREKQAMEEIAALVPECVGEDWRSLWAEYEAGVSPEAIAVKQLDKFDMIAQAFEYEQGQSGLDLEQFFVSTVGYFKTAPFIDWDRRLREKRAQFWKQRGRGN